MWYVFLLMSIGLIIISLKFPPKDGDDNEVDKVNHRSALWGGIVFAALSLIYILIGLGILPSE